MSKGEYKSLEEERSTNYTKSDASIKGAHSNRGNFSTPTSDTNSIIGSLKMSLKGDSLKSDDLNSSSNWDINDFGSNSDIHIDKQHRSWVDPWEISPSDEYYRNDRVSPLPQIVASSIDPKFAGIGSVNVNLGPLSEDTEYKLDNNYDEIQIIKDAIAGDIKDAVTSSKKFGPWDGMN